MNKKRKAAKKKQRVRARRDEQRKANPEKKGIDLFGDNFATVRRGNLPSGEHSDPRMNMSFKDIDPCNLESKGAPKQSLPLDFSAFGKAQQ